MKRKSLLISASFLASLICSQAWAADFTFKVPVRVENVPTIEGVAVECYVSRAPLGAPGVAAPSNVIGRGRSTPVIIRCGRYSGTVGVKVDASGIIPASSARSYGCNIRGWGRATTGAGYSAMPSNFRRIYETATGHITGPPDHSHDRRFLMLLLQFAQPHRETCHGNRQLLSFGGRLTPATEWKAPAIGWLAHSRAVLGCRVADDSASPRWFRSS